MLSGKVDRVMPQNFTDVVHWTSLLGEFDPKRMAHVMDAQPVVTGCGPGLLAGNGHPVSRPFPKCVPMIENIIGLRRHRGDPA